MVERFEKVVAWTDPTKGKIEDEDYIKMTKAPPKGKRVF